MQVLHRKLIRDLFHLRGQVLAVAAVVACGIGVFILVRSMYESMEFERDTYYEQYNFADIFTIVKEAPDYVADRILAIPGINSVSTRLVFDVTIQVPGLHESGTGHFVSLPFYGKPTINSIFLRSGRFIDSSHDYETVASESFMKANNLKLGDSVRAVLNGRMQAFQIVGVGLSPEFVYAIKGGASIFPDDRHYGIFWVSRKTLEHAFDMTGSFNDAALVLSRSANKEDVIASLDRLLKPYGSIGAYDRHLQVSNQLLQSEIDSYKALSTMLPLLFLAVAAFLIHIILTRFISTEREQIAVLKAFGYSNIRVAAHYTEFAMITVFVGAFSGIVIGIWGGNKLLNVELQYFNFPSLPFHFDISIFIFALAVTVIASALGALNAARAAFRLAPAEGMRPQSPTKFKRGFFERLGVNRILATSGRMALRDFERKPLKPLLSILTVGFAIALLIAGSALIDSIDEMISIEFYLAQHQDLTVGFRSPRSARGVLYDLSRIPGVISVEGSRTIPVDISRKSRMKRLAIQAFEPSGTLRRIVDNKRIIHQLPVQGIAISTYLATELAVNLGDTVTINVLEGKQRTDFLIVQDTINDLLGLNAYINLETAVKLTGETKDYSEAMLKIDPNNTMQIQHDLENMPMVNAVTLLTQIIADYQKTVADSMLSINFVFILFASVLAFGVIYNSGRITLSERGREFASLRVLGFTKREVAMILIGQQTTIVLLGIPVGFCIGYLLNMALISSYSTELYRMPFVFTMKSLGYSAIVVVAAAIISNLFIVRRVYQLDIIEVLKTRE